MSEAINTIDLIDGLLMQTLQEKKYLTNKQAEKLGETSRRAVKAIKDNEPEVVQDMWFERFTGCVADIANSKT